MQVLLFNINPPEAFLISTGTGTIFTCEKHVADKRSNIIRIFFFIKIICVSFQLPRPSGWEKDYFLLSALAKIAVAFSTLAKACLKPSILTRPEGRAIHVC